MQYIFYILFDESIADVWQITDFIFAKMTKELLWYIYIFTPVRVSNNSELKGAHFGI